jgi:hypothetical protein
VIHAGDNDVPTHPSEFQNSLPEKLMNGDKVYAILVSTDPDVEVIGFKPIVKEIKDIKKTDKGFVISTSDGRNHTLNFSSENGIPYLTLDGKKMLLNYATGKGGTFWYNPEDGSWNAINGQIIPFDDEFKKGEVVKVKDGKVMGVPGKNPVEKRITGSRKSFSLSLPGITPKDIILIGFLFVVVAFFYLFRVAT